MNDLQTKAFSLREKFVVDISTVLCDSKNIFKFKQKIAELRGKVLKMSNLETELMTANDTIRGLEETISKLKNSRTEDGSTNGTINKDGRRSITDERLSNNQISTETKIMYNSEFTYVSDTTSAPLNVKEGSIGAAAAVNRQINFLADLEDKLLLHIFTFLTTPEVLHSAQVNRSVFKRVDTLFGIDSQVVKESNWDDLAPVPAIGVDSSNSKGSAAIASSNSTNLMNNIINNIQNNILIQNGQHIFGSIVTNVTAKKEHRNSFDGNVQISSGGFTAASGSPAGNSTSASIPVLASLSAISSDIADSLSKKLTSVELKAIVSLSDKMKKQQMAIDTLLLEKEDLLARATGAESVRDFLVEKLKNAELAIKAYMGEVSVLKKQASADHEVISFLDIKGQELEALHNEMAFKNTQLQSSFDLQSNAFLVKEKYLLSQLSEYTKKCAEYETTYKSQKKVLVKEVKNLRVQVEQLTSERNKYKVQLKTLRDAVASVDNGGSNKMTRSLFS